ncbi:hypothetical protein FMEAI12_7050002 [Parafrankia sp. Ea1.12]|nr:hypothetical protein FMEAI12_7050002 [Parafrankia sp. Ea1.12]
MCFSRTVEGSTIFLSVRFQSDFDKASADALGRDLRDFGLRVEVMRDGLMAC